MRAFDVLVGMWRLGLKEEVEGGCGEMGRGKSDDARNGAGGRRRG